MDDPATSAKNPHEIALLGRVRAYLEASGITPSAFGKLVCGDPKLVSDIEKGREIRLATATRIEIELRVGWSRLADIVDQHRTASRTVSAVA